MTSTQCKTADNEPEIILCRGPAQKPGCLLLSADCFPMLLTAEQHCRIATCLRERGRRHESAAAIQNRVCSKGRLVSRMLARIRAKRDAAALAFKQETRPEVTLEGQGSSRIG